MLTKWPTSFCNIAAREQVVFTAVDTLHGINMKMECHLSDMIELPLCPSNPQEIVTEKIKGNVFQ